MITRFLRSRVGIALVVAVVIIGAALAVKMRPAAKAPAADLSAQVRLIADASLAKALKNGDLANLDNVIGTSSPFSDATTTLAAPAATETPENLTPTDRLARDFFTKYVELKNSGAQIDATTGTQLVNDLLSKDYGASVQEKVYTEKDIRILNTTSLSALKSYGNALGAILDTPLPKGYRQELEVISQVADSKDPESEENAQALASLSQNVARYKDMRNKAAALTVPAALQKAHVALLNSLSAILEGVEGMTFIETDPVGATQMIARYQDGINSLSLSLATVRAYLLKQDISYTSTESGYILTQ